MAHAAAVHVSKLSVRPSADDVESATSILLECFGDDAVIKAAGGFDASIVEAMLRHRVQHGRPDWDVYVAKVDGVICGAALVVPPGRAYAPDPSDILDRIDGEIQEWHDKIFFPKLEQLDQAAFGPTGIELPLHIALLAITSSHRNSGLGTRLIQHAIRIADQHGAGVSLNAEVPSLLQYYSQRGFEAKAERMIAVTPAGHCIRSWGLLRPLRAHDA